MTCFYFKSGNYWIFSNYKFNKLRVGSCITIFMMRQLIIEQFYEYAKIILQSIFGPFPFKITPNKAQLTATPFSSPHTSMSPLASERVTQRVC